MNLLVTNTGEEQAYLVLRSLRKACDRIVITVPEGGPLARWSGTCAWSRFVDRRYPVPDCTADWATGRLDADNTPAEEAWIGRIEEICARESITVIFPSYDAEVYVLSKNLDRLAQRGVLCPVPPFDRLVRILDKSLTLEAASAAGFPAPATRCPGTEAELAEAARVLAAPWVLKPRCNAHGAEMHFAEDRNELETAWKRLVAVTPRPLVQEYIPAGSKRNFYTLVDRDFEVVSLVSPEVHRLRRTGLRTPCAAVESTRDIPLAGAIGDLVRELGVWGCMTIQTVVDERDGIPRLMEANPRFGHNLWYRTELGIDEPALLLAIARGERVAPPAPIREGVLMLDPLWDLLHLAGQTVDRSGDWLRRRLGGAPRHDGALERDTVSFLLSAYRRDYLSRRPRVTSPMNRGYLTDPLPPLVRMGRTCMEAVRRRAS